MPKNIAVRYCAITIGKEPRYEATVGDRVFIREGKTMYEAIILEIPSPDSVYVRDESKWPVWDRTVPTSAIDMLLLD